MSSQRVEYEISNMTSIVFEVTENCNLSCQYCFYGENYKQYDTRKNYNLSVENAIAILKMLTQKWMSKRNISPEKAIFIGFYGGEPLINFDFINSIVNYIKDLQLKTGLKFRFNMTTNAVLLDKYIDFIVENNFSLTISLDGDSIGNSYRIFPNGKPSFDLVKKNAHLLKDKYPDFFTKNVFFNAVLHDRNNLLESERFILKEFGIALGGTEVNPLLVGKKFKYGGHVFDFNKKEDSEYFFKSAETSRINMFLRNFSNFHFENYHEMVSCTTPSRIFPTGTCSPFSRTMFITAQGKILPCETIGHDFALGKVENGIVDLKIQSIVDNYNYYFSKISKRCNNCYRINFCTDCLFLNIIKENHVLKCKKMNNQNHSKLLSEYYSLIESFPEMYKKIWEDTRNV